MFAPPRAPARASSEQFERAPVPLQLFARRVFGKELVAIWWGHFQKRGGRLRSRRVKSKPEKWKEMSAHGF